MTDIEFLERNVTVEEYQVAVELFTQMLEGGADTRKAIAMVYRKGLDNGRRGEAERQRLQAKHKAYREKHITTNIDSQLMAEKEEDSQNGQ